MAWSTPQYDPLTQESMDALVQIDAELVAQTHSLDEINARLCHVEAELEPGRLVYTVNRLISSGSLSMWVVPMFFVVFFVGMVFAELFGSTFAILNAELTSSGPFLFSIMTATLVTCVPTIGLIVYRRRHKHLLRAHHAELHQELASLRAKCSAAEVNKARLLNQRRALVSDVQDRDPRFDGQLSISVEPTHEGALSHVEQPSRLVQSKKYDL